MPRSAARQSRPRETWRRARIAAAIGPLLLAGCGAGADDLAPGVVVDTNAFQGLVAADEPRAALIGQQILLGGGSAADAAVAMAVAMSVTLPSRVSLDASGMCLNYDVSERSAETLDLAARPDGAPGVPSLPRGLYSMQAKSGVLRWQSLIAPAENLARFGFDISRALARDIAAAGPGNGADTGAVTKTIGLTGDGRVRTVGDRLMQPELSATLSLLRARGPGDFYGGEAARIWKAGLTGPTAPDPAVWRQYRPVWRAPAEMALGSEIALAPESSRLATPMLEIARDLVAGRLEPAGVGARADAATRADVAPSAGLVVADWTGDAVACTFTLGRLFGANRFIGATGVVAAADAAPGAARTDSLPFLIVNPLVDEFRYAAAASGPTALRDAGQTFAAWYIGGVGGLDAAGVSAQGDPRGRQTALYCARGIPPFPESCGWFSDGRGAGLARLVGSLETRSP